MQRVAVAAEAREQGDFFLAEGSLGCEAGPVVLEEGCEEGV